MTIQAKCQQLALQNNLVFNEILRCRGLHSLKEIPNFDANILDTALAYNIAVAAHAGVLDKGGIPYINHPMYVASQFSCSYRISLGYLHDVVEDNPNYSFSTLQEAGIHPRVLQALRAMTHKSGSYESYICKVATDPIAVDVKLADIMHNSDITRLKVFDVRALNRMKRYNAALKFFAENNFGIRYCNCAVK